MSITDDSARSADPGRCSVMQAAHLIVGLALGVEVAAALAAAHGQRRQAVLQDLRVVGKQTFSTVTDLTI